MWWGKLQHNYKDIYVPDKSLLFCRQMSTDSLLKLSLDDQLPL